MRCILDKNFLEALWKANFEKIINYILKICELIVEDYNKKQLKLPNDENKIRSIMLEEYIKKYKEPQDMLNYKFDLEVPENYDGNGQHIGRVDMRVLLKNDFEKDDAYYIIECKRIDGTYNLNQKYVKEGINRFVTQKYSSYYGRNIMLGFVVKKINISDNAKLIENIQNKEIAESIYGKFEFVGSNSVVERYKCIYQIESKKLELCHIFSDYSSIM